MYAYGSSQYELKKLRDSLTELGDKANNMTPDDDDWDGRPFGMSKKVSEIPKIFKEANRKTQEYAFQRLTDYVCEKCGMSDMNSWDNSGICKLGGFDIRHLGSCRDFFPKKLKDFAKESKNFNKLKNEEIKMFDFLVRLKDMFGDIRFPK